MSVMGFTVSLTTQEKHTMITLDNVKQVFSSGGLAYPYPRLGKISINGGRGEIATKDAIKYAQQVLKDRKG